MNDPSISTGHQYSYTAAKPLGAQTITIHCDLYQGTTLIKQGATNTITSSTYTQYDETLSGGQADAISDYTDLRVRCVPETAGGGGQGSRLEVSWIEFQTPDATTTHDINVSEINEASDSHTITVVKTWNINVNESVEGSDSHSITIDQVWNIIVGEQVLGNDVSNTVNAGTVHNINVNESVEGDDGHTFTFVREIIVTEENQGSDSSSVSAFQIWNIYASESVEGSDTNQIGTITPFAPGGQYIWFKVSAPTDSRLGGVFSFDCGTGFYVQGISSNGTLICTALP